MPHNAVISQGERIQNLEDAFLASTYGVKLFIDIPVYKKLDTLKQKTDRGEDLTDWDLAYLDHLERMPK